MINYMYLCFINILVNIYFIGDVGIFIIRFFFFILEWIFCFKFNINCYIVENLLVKWCEIKFFVKIKEMVENNYFLRKCVLLFDLVECF